MTSSDNLLKTTILEKLSFEPGLNSKNIVVHVEDNVTVLSGSVGTYYEKTLAEKAAKSVRGIKGVVNELQVSLGESLKRSDEEIVKAALRALEWDSSLPFQKIQVSVDHGVISLTGNVETQYQRESAYRDVKYLYGVKNVINKIHIHPMVVVRPEDVSDQILREFQRDATLDAKSIQVLTEGSKVILKGAVRSWAEYDKACHAAWSVLGVTEVDSTHLDIRYS